MTDEQKGYGWDALKKLTELPIESKERPYATYQYDLYRVFEAYSYGLSDGCIYDYVYTNDWLLDRMICSVSERKMFYEIVPPDDPIRFVLSIKNRPTGAEGASYAILYKSIMTHSKFYYINEELCDVYKELKENGEQDEPTEYDYCYELNGIEGGLYPRPL
jgi:hypothetical protein